MPTIRFTNSADMRMAATTRIDDDGLERYVGDDGYDYEDKEEEDEIWLLRNPATVGGFKDRESLTGRPYATARWSKADIATEKELIKKAVMMTKHRVHLNKVRGPWAEKLDRKPSDEKLQAIVQELDWDIERAVEDHKYELEILFEFQIKRITNPRTRDRLRRYMRGGPDF